MIPKSTIPHIVLEAGLPPRFRYWSGESGRRYLFTISDVETARHFQGAVAIVARFGRIVWAGRISDGECSNYPMHQLSRRTGAQVFVHLLARNEAQRSQIINDLNGSIELNQVETDHSARILEFPTAA